MKYAMTCHLYKDYMMNEKMIDNLKLIQSLIENTNILKAKLEHGEVPNNGKLILTIEIYQ